MRKKDKKTVVHVDDDNEWRFIVKRVIGDRHDLRSYDSIDDAKSQEETADAFIVDGNVKTPHAGDGIAWYFKLLDLGKKVLLLSGFIPYGIRGIDKANLVDKQQELLDFLDE